MSSVRVKIDHIEENGQFHGIADVALPEDQNNTHFGITAKQWLADQRVCGLPLDDHHTALKVGHIVKPYIMPDPDEKGGQLLAFVGQVDMNTPLGKSYYKRIRDGDESLFLSIQYTQNIELGGDGRKRLTGKQVDGVAFHHQPRNKKCRITVRQGDDASTVVLTLPVRIVVPRSTKASTPAEALSGLQFPVLTTKMSSPAPVPAPTLAAATATEKPQTPVVPVATPAAAAAVPMETTPTPTSSAQTAAAKATTSEQQQAPDHFETAQNIAKMNTEQLRRAALETEQLRRQLEEMNAWKKQHDEAQFAQKKADEERRQKESEEQLKQFRSVWAPVVTGADGKEDPQMLAAAMHLVKDPNSEQSGAKTLFLGVMESTKKAQEEIETLKKKNEELLFVMDAVKQNKYARTPAAPSVSTAAAIKTMQQQQQQQQQFQSSARPAAAGAAAASAASAVVATNNKPPMSASPSAARTEQEIRREIEAEMRTASMTTRGAPDANVALNPATLLSLPVQSGSSLTFLSPVQDAARSRGGLATFAPRPITVSQGAGTGTPSTGDAVSDGYMAMAGDEPNVKRIVDCVNTGNPNFVRALNGDMFDVRQLYQFQERTYAAPLSDLDRMALINTHLNQGLGRSYAPRNYVEMFDPRVNPGMNLRGASQQQHLVSGKRTYN
jgi:hypothetical protein